MPVPSALVCVHCSARYPTTHYDQDCPACRAKGISANLTVAYDSRPGEGLDQERPPHRPGSLWRWDDFLHASAAEEIGRAHV